MGTPQTSGWDPHRSVDCRTAAERGAEPPDGGKGGDPRMAGRGTRKIATSRYCGVTSYISCQGERKCKYNDVHVEIDDDAYALLLQSGVDDSRPAPVDQKKPSLRAKARRVFVSARRAAQRRSSCLQKPFCCGKKMRSITCTVGSYPGHLRVEGWRSSSPGRAACVPRSRHV